MNTIIVGKTKIVSPSDNAVNAAKMVQQALVDSSFPTTVMPFVMDQAAYETGGFQSKAFLDNNNASGIKPNSHAKAGKDANYAGYPSVDAWATDMKRVISMAPAYPIQATSLQDYVHRLKMNGYFGDNEATYLKGLQSEGTIWRNIMSLDTDSNTQLTYGPGGPPNELSQMWSKLSLPEKIAIGVLGAIVVVKIIEN